MIMCIEGFLWIFEDGLPTVLYTGYSCLSPAKFGSCVPSDKNIMGTTVSPTLRVELTSIRTLLSLGILSYLCCPQCTCQY
jgi:hypothetical protein